jgi:hypothetical protein
MRVKNPLAARLRAAPLGVRLCVYLLIGLALSPVVLSEWNGDSWSKELRLAVGPTLVLVGVAEVARWLDRRGG